MAEIFVNFASKGDEDVLSAIKKVTRHVGDLKRIAKTPIDLDIVKKSMPTADFRRLVDTIDRAKEATRDYGKEAERASKMAERAAMAAERATARKLAAEEKARVRMIAAAERATAKEEALAARSAARYEREAQRKAVAAEKAAARAAAAAEKAAAREARANPSMGGITGSMMGGGGKGPLLPLGGGPINTPINPKDFSPKAIDDLNKSLGLVPKRAQAAAQGLGFVGRILAAMAVRSFVREVYEMANAWTAFENKIKTVLTHQEDLAFITKDLIGISQRSRMSLEAVGTIYTRTARAVAALGKSQADTAKFTETLSKAVAVGGSTSIEAKNAMIQLSQGLSSGTLKGDELRSVLEQLPIVAELIAKKLGVTTGALRKLGSEGKLSTDVVFSAIIEATADIDERFAKMKPTMESVIQVIKDKFMVAIGQSSGAIDLATRALQLLSDNFDMAFRAATALAGVMAAMATGKFAMWAAAGLANPWVALAVAVAALTVAYTAFSDKIEISKDGTLKLNDVTNAWVSTFTKGIQEMLEGVGKLSTTLLAFIAGPFAVLTKPFKFSWDIDTLVDRLAIATDVMRVLADPGRMALAAVRDNPEDREWSQRTQNALKRERALAKGAEKDAFWVKQNETEAKWNAMMRDANKVGAASAVTPVKKGGGKEHGKTFEELIKEALFDEQNSKWSETEEKIRDRLHNMMEKLKPSIKAALEGVEGKVAAARRDFESEYAKNDGWGFNPAAEARARKTMESRIAGINSAHEAALKERDVLEDIVRQEATREFYAKQKLEDEKEMEAFLDERLKQMKEMEELEKRNRDKRSDKAVALSGSMTGIASSLSPNVAIAQRIAELQKFQDFARQNNLAEWASRANDEIQSLQRTMLFGMDPLKEYGDQMKSIFGPGGTLVKGFADAAANAIVMSQSLGDLRKALVDVLNSVQKQAISSLIQLPLNIAMGALTNSLTGGAGGSSLGGGARSLSAAEASNIQFSSGGYTGNMGTNEPAGIVHGQEFVLNADATRRMGKQNLDMINKGGTPTSASAVPANITINNNAGVIVETRQLSPGDVEVIVSKAIRDQTGRVVAGQINDPNSMVSRSMQKNIGNGERRRV